MLRLGKLLAGGLGCRFPFDELPVADPNSLLFDAIAPVATEQHA